MTKCQNDVLCGNMNMDDSPYILKFKFFFKNTGSTMTAWNHVVSKNLLQPKSEMVYLPKKVCLIIIQTNTTHILDMPCCRQHQQQSNDIMQRVTMTFSCHHTRYHTLSLSLVWFGAICNALPRVTVKFINICIYIF